MFLLFAYRYFKAKKSTNSINIIAWVSVVAIFTGTAALVLVLCVFNGFEDLVKSLYSSFYPNFKISAASGKEIKITDEQLNRLKQLKDVKNFSLVTEEKVLVQNGDFQSFLHLKGVDGNYRYTTGVEKNVIRGQFDLGTASAPKIVLGEGIENRLGIRTGQMNFNLNIILPRKSETENIDLLSDLSVDTIFPSGTFKIQQDFDNNYGITNIDFVKKATLTPNNTYTAIEIATVPEASEKSVKTNLQQIFKSPYKVETIYEQNRTLYSAMQLERWAIYAVLCLILVIAAFNMIGALFILILEKQKDIHVLKAMGASNSVINRIFLTEGMLLAFIGSAGGMLVAYLLAWLQLKFHLVPLKGGSFLIDYYPVKLKLTDFLLVSATVFVIALIASWVPARKAALTEVSLRTD